ncbi:MAG: NAD(+) synthase [Actinobacteria bacterium]|nr:NAD(+) synthase [Actinomycetota bacterium]
MHRFAEHLIEWIHAEGESSGGLGVVLGLSGGLDSALVAALAKKAYPHHSLGVLMPCHSDPQDTEDALLVAGHFGLATATVDLSPVHDLLIAQIAAVRTDLPDTRLACANVKPRLRMTTLYVFSNLLGYRVLGSSNRSEIHVGYFTKHGDGGADLLPLGALTKSQVRALAEHLEIPRRIIDKPPSAGLWAGQTDEGEMGLTYEELDAYLMGFGDPSHHLVDAMHAASQHKRELPKIAPLNEETTTGTKPGPRGR